MELYELAEKCLNFAKQSRAEKEKLEQETVAIEKNCDYWADKCHRLESRLQAVSSEINLSDYPSWTEENIVEHTKELMIRNLGRAVYEQAVHSVADGKYTASVVVLDEEKKAYDKR